MCKYISVSLVESTSRPCGMQLVNSKKTNKCADPMDLVELATQVQKVKENYLQLVSKELTQEINISEFRL